jgi:hypothetical protein
LKPGTTIVKPNPAEIKKVEIKTVDPKKPADIKKAEQQKPAPATGPAKKVEPAPVQN